MRQWLGVLLLCLGVVFLLGCPTGGSSGGSELAEDWDVPVESENKYKIDTHLLEFYKNKGHLGEDWNRKFNPSAGEDGNIDMGDPVFACAYGIVRTVQDIDYEDSWGKVVQIEHSLPTGEKFYTVYAHLKTIDEQIIKGKVGEKEVYPGDPIGQIGDGNGYYTNHGSSAHLHIELRDEDTPWDPTDYFGHGYLEHIYPNEVQHFRALLLFVKMRQEQIKRELGSGIREIYTNVMTGGNLLSFEYKGQLANVYQAVDNGWVDYPQVYNEQYGVWQDMIVFHPDYRYRVNVRKSKVTMRLFQPDWADKKIGRDMALADFIAFALILDQFDKEVKGVPVASPYSELWSDSVIVEKSLKSAVRIVEIFPEELDTTASRPTGYPREDYQSIEVLASIEGYGDEEIKLYRSANADAPLQRVVFTDPDSALAGISASFLLPDNY